MIKTLFHVNNNRRCDASRLRCDKTIFLLEEEEEGRLSQKVYRAGY